MSRADHDRLIRCQARVTDLGRRLEEEREARIALRGEMVNMINGLAGRLDRRQNGLRRMGAAITAAAATLVAALFREVARK